MSYQPPPVTPGYSPPNWAPAPSPPTKPKRWGLAAVIAAAVLLVGIAWAVADWSTFTPEEAADEAQQACVEGYVPAKLAAMADPETARFSAVKVAAAGETYTVTGRVSADRISTGSLDGLPNRYRFECSLTRAGGKWVTNYSTVLPI